MVLISEFQIKDVVNVSDGKKLGTIGDLNIDLNTGEIKSVVVNTNSRLNFFGKEPEVMIPWYDIVKIGKDVILVRYKHIGQP